MDFLNPHDPDDDGFQMSPEAKLLYEQFRDARLEGHWAEYAGAETRYWGSLDTGSEEVDVDSVPKMVQEAQKLVSEMISCYQIGTDIQAHLNDTFGKYNINRFYASLLIKLIEVTLPCYSNGTPGTADEEKDPKLRRLNYAITSLLQAAIAYLSARD